MIRVLCYMWAIQNKGRDTLSCKRVQPEVCFNEARLEARIDSLIEQWHSIGTRIGGSVVGRKQLITDLRCPGSHCTNVHDKEAYHNSVNDVSMWVSNFATYDRLDLREILLLEWIKEVNVSSSYRIKQSIGSLQLQSGLQTRDSIYEEIPNK